MNKNTIFNGIERVDRKSAYKLNKDSKIYIA